MSFKQILVITLATFIASKSQGQVDTSPFFTGPTSSNDKLVLGGEDIVRFCKNYRMRNGVKSGFKDEAELMYSILEDIQAKQVQKDAYINLLELKDPSRIEKFKIEKNKLTLSEITWTNATTCKPCVKIMQSKLLEQGIAKLDPEESKRPIQKNILTFNLIGADAPDLNQYCGDHLFRGKVPYLALHRNRALNNKDIKDKRETVSKKVEEDVDFKDYEKYAIPFSDHPPKAFATIFQQTAAQLEPTIYVGGFSEANEHK